MMPLTGWLKSWVTESYHPPGKDENTMIAESLMMELDYQMKEIERVVLEREQEEKRKTSGVDYSWLVNAQHKPYEIPQLERLELEELFMKLKPSECGRIITSFRDSLLREPEVHELPRILRAIVIQTLESRPKEESMSEWVTRRTVSLTRLRPSKISPINDDSDDIELKTRSKSVSGIYDHKENPFYAV